MNNPRTGRNAVVWNGVGTGLTTVIELISVYILARLLLPSDFGVVATVSIFLLVSDILVNSGLSQAIIRSFGGVVKPVL